MARRQNQQVHEDSWDYRHLSAIDESENVLRLFRSDAQDYGATALDLVNQAAEIFKGMEITLAKLKPGPSRCAGA